MDEQVRADGGLEHRSARRRVARDDDLAPGTRGAEHLLGRTDAPVGERDRLAALERAALGARRARRARPRPATSKRPGRSSSTSA